MKQQGMFEAARRKHGSPSRKLTRPERKHARALPVLSAPVVPSVASRYSRSDLLCSSSEERAAAIAELEAYLFLTALACGLPRRLCGL